MPNRLQYEKSPYLLQHAENPVDWRPWGADAFEEARREDKPVLLSIGYSTCHWCHVMAHESFEDEAVAEAVNGAFLPIKVDREERPDVDAVYMAACIAQTGSGGWPLTVLLTPEQKPFWAGTYLPRRQLLSLLDQAARLWREDRGTLLAAGDALTEFLRREEAARPGVPKRELVESGAALFRRMFDRQWGGFGQAPKFPAAHNLLFLLCYAGRTGDVGAREMAESTLEHMYRGGLFDHVGGGFSRYSTDRRWLVPHFEKMLYDNALLAMAYLEAYQQSGPLLLPDCGPAHAGLCTGGAHRPSGRILLRPGRRQRGGRGQVLRLYARRAGKASGIGSGALLPPVRGDWPGEF